MAIFQGSTGESPKEDVVKLVRRLGFRTRVPALLFQVVYSFDSNFHSSLTSGSHEENKSQRTVVRIQRRGKATHCCGNSDSSHDFGNQHGGFSGKLKVDQPYDPAIPLHV